jgi:glyoxylase-like metal-dependent hydrolase (beta-lactamase superfamily II)
MQTRLPGVVGLDAANPGPLTGAGNHTWLLTGKVPTLIDAGVGAPTHLDAIAAALEAVGQTLRQVVVTHAHSDHASGAVAVSERWPSALFVKWPWPDGDRRYRVPWIPLAEGQMVAAGDHRLEVLHTPGHAPDHVCLWHGPSKSLFGGDLLIEGSTVVVPGTRGGDLIAYLDSLRRVAALGPRQVLPAHGPVIDEPLGLIERYSAHRTSREREILAAIDGGAASVDAVVATVYPAIVGPLRLVAIETAHAHVNKLRTERRIEGDDGRLHVVRGAGL